MADESFPNGAAAAAPNGDFFDADQTPTPHASSSTAFKALQPEILALKSANSDLEAELARSAAKLAAAEVELARSAAKLADTEAELALSAAKLADTEAEIARSEAEKQSLAAQAARLEGDIIRVQEDLTSAAYAAEAASKETLDLRQTVADLTAANAALEKKLNALKFDLEVEGVKAAGVNSKKDADYAALELKAAQLEEQLALAREEKEAVVAELNRGAVREADLGAAIQDLTQRNAELEGKVNGEVEREMAPVAVDNGVRVSWPTAAAAVASTATVAATAVVIYLRAKQR